MNNTYEIAEHLGINHDTDVSRINYHRDRDNNETTYDWENMDADYAMISYELMSHPEFKRDWEQLEKTFNLDIVGIYGDVDVMVVRKNHDH